MRTSDEQFLGGKARDDLAAILGDDELLFDARRRPAIGGGPEGLQREDHSFFDHLGMIERDQAAEDRLFPDREADAVAILQREGRLFIGEAELLGLRPELDDIGRRDAGLDGM